MFEGPWFEMRSTVCTFYLFKFKTCLSSVSAQIQKGCNHHLTIKFVMGRVVVIVICTVFWLLIDVWPVARSLIIYSALYQQPANISVIFWTSNNGTSHIKPQCSQCQGYTLQCPWTKVKAIFDFKAICGYIIPVLLKHFSSVHFS